MRLLLPAVLLLLPLAFTGCEQDTAKGKGGTELTLYKPIDEVLSRGERGEVDVRINRDDFDGPVVIELGGLPTGVRLTNSAEQALIRSGESSITLELFADPTAPLVKDHAVRVTAKADDKVASETFHVTVNEAD